MTALFNSQRASGNAVFGSQSYDGGGGDTTPPAMQGSISISALTTTGYTSSIDAATDAVGVTGYEVSQDGGINWIDKATSRTHSHSGRTPGTTDQVRWRARDAAGNLATPLTAAVTLLTPVVGVAGPMAVGAYFQMLLRASS